MKNNVLNWGVCVCGLQVVRLSGDRERLLIPGLSSQVQNGLLSETARSELQSPRSQWAEDAL